MAMAYAEFLLKIMLDFSGNTIKKADFSLTKIDKIGVKHFILDWKWNFIWIKGELKEETREDDECVNEQWYLKTWRCCIQSYDLRIFSSGSK